MIGTDDGRIVMTLDELQEIIATAQRTTTERVAARVAEAVSVSVAAAVGPAAVRSAIGPLVSETMRALAAAGYLRSVPLISAADPTGDATLAAEITARVAAIREDARDGDG